MKTKQSKAPFIAIGQRVRFIGANEHRQGDWTSDGWVSWGVKGTITKYRPSSPRVVIGRTVFEALEPWAVVRWDGCGEEALLADDEGTRWQRS